jgi:transcriptional activator of cad operon
MPLTASDDREINARYSIDGRYLVFYRSQNKSRYHIWAKDLATKQEYQLTKNAGYYGSHSWSEDGNQLTFVEQESQSLQ